MDDSQWLGDFPISYSETKNAEKIKETIIVQERLGLSNMFHRIVAKKWGKVQQGYCLLV